MRHCAKFRANRSNRCGDMAILRVTYTVHLWLDGKRVVDFLLALTERSSGILDF